MIMVGGKQIMEKYKRMIFERWPSEPVFLKTISRFGGGGITFRPSVLGLLLAKPKPSLGA